MDRHPQYPMIFQRSWDAVMRFVVKGPASLDHVLRAMRLRPERAKSYEELPFMLDTRYENFASEGRAASAIEAVSIWAKRRWSATSTLAEIAEWNRQLGVWCAARVASAALPYAKRFVGDRPSRLDDRPRICVSVVESWALGDADDRSVLEAKKGSEATSDEAAIVIAMIRKKVDGDLDRLRSGNFENFAKANASFFAASSAFHLAGLVFSRSPESAADGVVTFAAESIAHASASKKTFSSESDYRRDVFVTASKTADDFRLSISEACIDYLNETENKKTDEDWMAVVDPYSHVPSRGVSSSRARSAVSILAGAAAGAAGMLVISRRR